METMNNQSNAHTFSFFRMPITNTKPSSVFSLLDAYKYIVGENAMKQTDILRSIIDDKQRKEFKAKNFDYCTFSGTFHYRNDKGLLRHSGLLCLDFDHLANIEDVKKLLLQDRYFDTMLMFRSPSGDGLKWVVRINLEEASHHNYFQAASNYLSKTYSLQADKSGKDISRACFLPHDPDCIYNQVNPNREKFNPNNWQATSINQINHITPISYHSNLSQEIENLTMLIESSSIDIAPAYADWRDLGFALADALGENGRSYYHRLSRFHPSYSSDETDKQFSACLKAHGHGVTSKTFFHLVKQSGITIHSRSNSPFPAPAHVPAPVPISPTSSKSSPEEIAEIEEMEVMPTFSQNVKDRLPFMLSEIAYKAKSPEEADLFILGALTVFSACLPNVYGNYAGREVFPNLFLFVAAQASAGKGSLSLCRHLVQPIHDNLRQHHLMELEEYKRLMNEYNADKVNNQPPQEPAQKTLFIPANSSATSVYQLLYENEGKGLLFETEGDTLANTFKSDFGNFSDGFRKAFHHEMISYTRRKDREFVELPKPRLSALLSGTPRQILALVPDTENGLFSRFIFYYMNIRLEWKNVFAESQETLDESFKTIGYEFYELHKLLKTQQRMRFALSTSQQDKFNEFFNRMQNEYSMLFGLDIIASIRRLGLITFRIAMILTVLNVREYEDLSQILMCSDNDFETTMIIVETLLKHTSKVYETLPVKDPSATVKGQLVIKQSFFDSLPQRFNRQMYLEVANNLKIPSKTSERYIYQFVASAKLKHLAHDSYEKV